ncbi:hypothetical protein M422DRAFT_67289 [Sphaerobolus stellatus SS14]|uniref:Uncharacterized protein n=1 Tax=Sphaerobolus stellatus (strain SS14) TaxID=990650 RepID=A0A0C9W2B0_SPHS4|nr:hypothetical protein M422DRAFT_67289 [Sphaerobolus stellatus SS14]
MTSPTLPNPPNVISPFVSSPTGSSFVPRREFALQPVHQPSSFALLAFSSNNVIRLSNFPPVVVGDLRTRLGNIVGLHSFRENAEQTLCELVLTGKPWSNNKSLSTEVLIVQVFSIVLLHGYAILSQLHYGKEHNDRLTFAFTKLDMQDTRQTLIPFALSFTSSTSLRVVCSPLHATPAILQSVRGAWPRGVLSEKKIGEHCYEFKLKGYSWFQEDTFADDALAHMLTLLTSLDKHNWTFITSVALSSNHSRNRDLWMFAGPSSSMPRQAGIRPATPVNLGSPLKPSVHEPIIDRREGSGDSDMADAAEAFHHHARSATESRVEIPAQSSPERTIQAAHARSASDTPTLLRKKGPPKPLTSSHHVKHGLNADESIPELLGADLAASSPEEPSSGQQSPHTPLGDPPRHSLVSLPEAVDHRDNQDDEDSKRESAAGFGGNVSSNVPDMATPPLLGPTAFRRSGSDDYRNSILSDGTRRSFDVPLTWIPNDQGMSSSGSNNELQQGDKQGDDAAISKRLSPSAFPEAVDERRQSLLTTTTQTTGPLPPGAWLNTPTVEAANPIPEEGLLDPNSAVSLEPRHSIIVSRSPIIVHPELPDDHKTHPSSPRRKSETGVVGLVSELARITPTEPLPNGTVVDKETQANKRPHETVQKRIAEGSWVVVGDSPDMSQPSTAAIGNATSPASPVQEYGVEPSGSQTTEIPVDGGSRPASPRSRRNTPSKSEETIMSARKERSMFGRLLSRRGGSRRGKTADVYEDSDKEKSASKLKKSGNILPTIRSGRRVSVD